MGEIILGDSEKVLAGFPDDYVDLTITSPPYDELRDYESGNPTFDFEIIAQQLFRVTKPGGIVVWVVGDQTIDGSETGTSFRQALYFMQCGFKLHDTMIYEKNGPAYPNGNRYHQVFEFMFVFSKGYPKTVNLLKDRKNRWAGMSNFGTRNNRTKNGSISSSSLNGRKINEYGTRFNIWKISGGFGYSTKDKIAFEHPATFPEQLANDHILSWSNPGDLVLDPFAGSGTTAKKSKELGREFIAIEREKKYIQIIKKRLAATNPPLFTNG